MKDIKTIICTCGGEFKIDFNDYEEVAICPKCNFDYIPYLLIETVRTFIENKSDIANLKQIKLT